MLETIVDQDSMKVMETIKTVSITINGKSIKAREGVTILEAAREAYIYIPTLCYDEDMVPYGACRLCLVEVTTANGRKKLVASCLYPVEDELTVETSTEKIANNRKMLMQLLLARCPEVKEIQEMAKRLGVEDTPFNKDYKKCILCGLCVRACQDIVGVSAISLVNRGIYKEVAAPFYVYELGEGCIGCGDCSFVCPTGAIKMGSDGKPILPRVKIPYAELEAMASK